MGIGVRYAARATNPPFTSQQTESVRLAAQREHSDNTTRTQGELQCTLITGVLQACTPVRSLSVGQLAHPQRTPAHPSPHPTPPPPPQTQERRSDAFPCENVCVCVCVCAWCPETEQCGCVPLSHHVGLLSVRPTNRLHHGWRLAARARLQGRERTHPLSRHLRLDCV